MDNGQMTMDNFRTTTEFRLVDIDQLIPYVNNARTHSQEQIDMMLGTSFETQLLFERVQRNYNAGFWTIEHLRQAVEHNWINETDYENLTGEPYAPDEEDNTDDQG